MDKICFPALVRILPAQKSFFHINESRISSLVMFLQQPTWQAWYKDDLSWPAIHFTGSCECFVIEYKTICLIVWALGKYMRMSSTRMYKSWENPSTVNTEVKTVWIVLHNGISVCWEISRIFHLQHSGQRYFSLICERLHEVGYIVPEYQTFLWNSQ